MTIRRGKKGEKPSTSAWRVEKRQIDNLRTLVEIAQGKHDARTLARITFETLGAGGGMMYLPDSEMAEFRAWLREGLQKMFEKGWEVSLSDPDFSGYRTKLYVQRTTTFEDLTGRAAPRLASLYLADLQKWRLAECQWPKCNLGPGGRPQKFVTHKRRQEACCTRHAQNLRQWRHRHQPAPAVRQLAAADLKDLTAAGVSKKEIRVAARKLKQMLAMPPRKRWTEED